MLATSRLPHISHPLASRRVFHLRQRSLLRGTLLVLASFVASFALSGFPNSRPTMLLVIPALATMYGTFDTVRCMQNRWSFYHGGVLLLVFMDMMVLCLVMSFLLFPYIL
jgi:hypothetical protein